MNAALQDFWRIARVTTVQRDKSTARMMKSVAGLLLLAFLVAGGIMAWRHLTDTLTLIIDLARVALGLATFWLAIVWVTVYVPGSLLLNSPANARLLPRQRRRLMQMTAIGWVACTAGFCTVFGSWVAAPLCGIYLLALSLLLTGHRQAAPLVFLACGWPMLTRSVLPPWVVETATRPATLVALIALVLIGGFYTLRLMYPDGGDRYLDKRAEMIKRIQRQSGASAGDMGAISGPSGRGILRVYGGAVRRAGRSGDAAALLMHALGPTAHWSAWLPTAAWLTVVAAGGRLLIMWAFPGRHRELLQGIGIGLASLTPLAAFVTAQFSQQMRRTRGEQSLLRLTPRAGDPAPLNRRLAGALLKAALTNWGIVTAAILLATLLIGGDAQALLRQFALCCLGGQVASMGLLGDYARDGGWRPMLALRAALAAAAEGAVAAGLGWLVGPSAWVWLILIALVAGVVQLLVDRQRMLAAPVAFPAGRLA